MSSDSPVTIVPPVAVSRRPPVRWTAAGLLALVGVVGLTAACSTGATSPTFTVPVSSRTVTEVFQSTLPVNGFRFYSFSIAGTGPITATLTSIGGTGVPPSVVVTMGIGSPGGVTCLPTTSAEVQVTGTASLTTQVTATPQEPGVFCVILRDTGNLFAPASFTVTIDHP